MAIEFLIRQHDATLMIGVEPVCPIPFAELYKFARWNSDGASWSIGRTLSPVQVFFDV